MAFKLRGTGTNKTKMYLFPLGDAEGPVRQYAYVSADTALVVEACGYITTATEDGQLAYNMLREGDLLWVYTVAAISDARAIWEDCKAGITALHCLAVIRKDADVLELSEPLFGQLAVSYTS